MTAPAAVSGRGGSGTAGTSLVSASLNPSCWSSAERAEFNIGFAPYSSGLSFLSASAAIPSQKMDFGLTFDFLGIPSEPQSEGGIALDKNLGYHDLAVGLSTALPLGKSHRIGATARYINRRIADSYAHSVSLDLGYLFSTSSWNYGTKTKTEQNLSFGLALRNAGAPTRFIEQSDQLPLMLSMGTAYQPIDHFRFFADGDWEIISQAFIPKTGAEFLLPWGVTLRAGAFWRDGALSATAGAGLARSVGGRLIGVDYSLEPLNTTDLSHRFTVTLGM
jgi:hypothetical protein